MELGIWLSLEVLLMKLGVQLSLEVLPMDVGVQLSLEVLPMELGIWLSLEVLPMELGVQLSLHVGFVTIHGVGFGPGSALVAIIVTTKSLAAAMVAGSSMGNMIHINPAAVFKIAVAATVIIIVHAAIDIDRFPVGNHVAGFITRSISWPISRVTRVAGGIIGIAAAHQGGQTQYWQE
jgi:hypothetical protein